MEKIYQIVLDQSTSGTKVLLLEKGLILKRYDKKHQQFYPKNGWVEQDPLEIWGNVQELLLLVLEENQLTFSDIAYLSLTNQRETIVAWDKVSGKPLHHAIVWQCNRSHSICNALISDGKEQLINQKTGLKIDPYFSGSKIKWLYDEVPLIQEKSRKNELAIGTIDSWLIWNLTDHEVFATDASNACRTLLYNIHEMCWDEELVALFNAQKKDLPEIRNADDFFGKYQGIPIKGVMADSQAALFGESCLAVGDVKITMGTGCSILMQVNDQSMLRDDRILTTVAWETKTARNYALEGIIRSCGDAINWFSETISTVEQVSDWCDEALDYKEETRVQFIPALQGMGAPFWNNQLSATFFEIARETTKKELFRAVLESLIFQVKAVIDTMEEVATCKINKIYVDGGISKNHLLMEMMATLLNKEIIVSEIEEFSAMGVAKMANEQLQSLTIKETYIQENKKYKGTLLKYKKWKRFIENLNEIENE